MRHPRTAIIDIGSNSIRLVVYQGPARLPAILFNEKVLAGLGRSLVATGKIDSGAMKAATAALGRFATLTREMGCDSVRTVATAAVRDANNGDQLIDIAANFGLAVELLSGEQEAIGAGHGVLSAIPHADGIVGDLGGGSLELVRVRKGEIRDRISFPLGVLRIAALREKNALDRRVAKLLREAGWSGAGKGLSLYLVGGSWRALARLDMDWTRYPLPVIHQYAMPPATIARLGRTISHVTKGKLKAVPGLSGGRIPTLGNAAALLSVLIKYLKSSGTIVSAYGLREGLLYGALDTSTRAEDPLVTAARDEGRRSGRFPEHGDLLEDWIAPLFEGDPDARLRHAACQLADVGWRANPEFRAERGVEIALHGNWVAIDARGRAMLAQSLWTSLGGSTAAPDPLPALANPDDLARATRWGLAMRLGQRLSAGLAGPLQRSRLGLDPATLTLRLSAEDQALYGEPVTKRHAALAAALGRRAALVD
ncbi:Ppx/GppA family phosphatase [Sphingomonas sp. SUN019]|uniref:Ppx/GppA family phosphatase n=1 Tax=Sphingomonas sp. SUN019 TaxID=2937788 RepID=UPI00216494A1|nr:Ppx/GppA family phosphatase [Sphingomonas sp. SUN019]UVO49217.1 Ppx/GppA family phosphatase [Sphingomonas sp. SUN019]